MPPRPLPFLFRLASLALVAAAALATPFARATGPSEGPASPGVDVVKVQGVIDPALSAYVRGSIKQAQDRAATVILQVDSRGAYGDEAVQLAKVIRSAGVPVVAWVGPSGARAEGGALFLVYASSFVAIAPGAGIGPARPFDLAVRASRESASAVRTNATELTTVTGGAGVPRTAIRRLVDGAQMPAQTALDSHAAALAAPDIPTLLHDLNGLRIVTPTGPVTLRTQAVGVSLRFHEIGFVQRLLHAVSTPTAVYVLLVLGLWGVAFEFTQSGVGMAGIAGGVALALAIYGLTVIPFAVLGLAFVLGGTLLQALDVLIRRVGVVTIAGTALFAVGSVQAWHGVSTEIDLAAWLIVFFSLGGLLFFGFGMTVALKARERVRSAQVGLVGLLGEARSDLNPEGGVYVKGTLWRGRSMNGPIPKGRRVRVKGIEGLILRVQEETVATPPEEEDLPPLN
ncbi:MAG TPA: hypothetical protein DIU14_00060 [Actinobacteria bacterium]|nr:hypothetical protein [Actinomycetota bacterium]